MEGMVERPGSRESLGFVNCAGTDLLNIQYSVHMRVQKGKYLQLFTLFEQISGATMSEEGYRLIFAL